MAWSAPTRAVCDLPLLDPECPTILVADALRQAGWFLGKRTVEHNAGLRLVADGRGGTKAKFYYQVFLSLMSCLRLCPRIPSGAVQSFYQCLLQGFRVAPGQPDKTYKAIIAADGDLGPLALEDEDEPQITDAIEDGLVFPGDSPRRRRAPVVSFCSPFSSVFFFIVLFSRSALFVCLLWPPALAVNSAQGKSGTRGTHQSKSGTRKASPGRSGGKEAPGALDSQLPWLQFDVNDGTQGSAQ